MSIGQRLSLEIVARIRAEYREGSSTQQIADRLGLNRGTVANQVSDLRLGRSKNVDVADLGNWHERAACNGLPVDVFFPSPADRAAIKFAIEICADCPVVAECLVYAQRTGSSEGVFGGRYLGVHPQRAFAA